MIRRIHWKSVLLFILLPFSVTAQDEGSQKEIYSASAKESVKFFDVPTGMELELVASEPHVVDPIAIRFDAQGRMWVVEMNDYPSGNGVNCRVSLISASDGGCWFLPPVFK